MIIDFLRLFKLWHDNDKINHQRFLNFHKKIDKMVGFPYLIYV